MFYLRILIVSHEFPPHVFGGIGIFCYNLANALAKRGIRVTVMAGCPSDAIKARLIELTETSNNLEIIRVPRINFPPSHFWYQMMNINAVSELISNFDIVHGQDCAAFPMISYCKKTNPKIPWVVTIHTNPTSQLYYALKSLMSLEGSFRDFITYIAGFPLWDVSLRGHAKFANALVAVSQSLSTEILNCYEINPEKLSIIHTGVDIAGLEEIAKSNSVHNSHSDEIQMFYAGRLYWGKGILHLLKSLVYLTRKFGFKDFQLHVFGCGPLEHRVKEFISSLNLTENVRLRGFVQHQELRGSMATSDIVCVPSLYEACPVGMIEAMALGKPVAAFNQPFSRELLDMPAGMLSKSIEAYARSLYSLCISENLRKDIGARLRTHARKKFDIKVVADNYLKLYRQLLS